MLYRNLQKILFSLILIVNIPFILDAQDIDELYSKGVEAYTNEDFAQAITHWEKLLASGYYSDKLYYNIGNAWFKEGSIPGAILYFEKALLLKPFNEDYRYNLEIAKSYTIDRFEIVPEVFFMKWYRMVSLVANSNQWAVMSLGFFIVSLILILLYLFSLHIGIKKSSFIAGLVFLFFSIIAISLSYMNHNIKQKHQYAIIYTPVVTGRSSPDLEAKELFVIHEGSKVRIEEQLGEWVEVRLSDGNIGWVLLADVRKV